MIESLGLALCWTIVYVLTTQIFVATLCRSCNTAVLHHVVSCYKSFSVIWAGAVRLKTTKKSMKDGPMDQRTDKAGCRVT